MRRRNFGDVLTGLTDRAAAALPEHDNPLPRAVHVWSIWQILNVLRGGIDYFAAGRLVFDTVNSVDVNNSTLTTLPTDAVKNAVLTWAGIEWAYAVFTTGFLLLRYGYQLNLSTLKPGAQVVFAFRICITVLSYAAAILLVTDISGTKNTSYVAFVYITLSTLINSALEERFVKQDKRALSNQRELLLRQKLNIPNNHTLSSEHTYLLNDMQLAYEGVVEEYHDLFFQQTANNAHHYRLAISDEEGLINIVLPLLHHPERAVGTPAVAAGLGQDDLGAYFNHHATNGLNTDLFDEISAELREAANHQYRILFPAQGLIDGKPQAWTTVEVKIKQSVRNGGTHYDIGIYQHSPFGGPCALTPVQYYRVAYALYTRLTGDAPNGFAIDANNLHFLTNTNGTHHDMRTAVTVPAGGDAGAAVAAPGAAALVAANIPTSDCKRRLDDNNVDHSSFVVLHDIQRLLRGNSLHDRVWSAAELGELRLRSAMRVLDTRKTTKMEQRQAFRNRAIRPVTVSNQLSLAATPGGTVDV